jgi:hypothetical protein
MEEVLASNDIADIMCNRLCRSCINPLLFVSKALHETWSQHCVIYFELGNLKFELRRHVQDDMRIRLPLCWTVFWNNFGEWAQVSNLIHSTDLFRRQLSSSHNLHSPLCRDIQHALVYVHDGSTSLHDTNMLLHLLGISSSVEEFQQTILMEIRPFLVHILSAERAYLKWSYRVSALRLGFSRSV